MPNLIRRKERNQKILDYLTTPLEYDESGKPIYPTLEDTATKFDLTQGHIFKIKKAALGLDSGIPGRMERRKVNEENN